MNWGLELTTWLARFAALASLVAVVWRLRRPHDDGWPRSLWIAGALGFLLHVIAAYQFVHRWSHQSAFDETALRTRAAMGVAVGVGLYVNYVFVLVWLGDALWWLADPASYRRRSAAVERTVQFFLAFILFNGVVVFAPPATRWIGAAGFAWLAWEWWRALHRRRPNDS